MPVRVVCSRCRASYEVADSLCGKKIKCRGCEESIAVPAVARRARAEPDAETGDRPRPPAAPPRKPAPRPRPDEPGTEDEGDERIQAARPRRRESPPEEIVPVRPKARSRSDEDETPDSAERPRQARSYARPAKTEQLDCAASPIHGARPRR